MIRKMVPDAVLCQSSDGDPATSPISGSLMR